MASQSGSAPPRAHPEAERASRRKVPRSEWEKILARRTGGETFAQIAQDYDCSAPAIRYIVSRIGGEKQKDRTPAAFQADAPLRPPYSSGFGFDDALRQRVSSSIASFLAAFDAAFNDRSSGSFAELLEVTDDLMGAIALTRVEVKRLRDAAAAGGAT
jgi:hypothetical protein